MKQIMRVMFYCMALFLMTSKAGFSQSLRFTDTSYVNLGNDASLHLTNFTIEGWIRIEGYGSTTNTGSGGVSGVIPVITKGRAEDESAAVDINYFLGYRLSDMKLVADFEDNATSLNHPVISNATLSLCTWTHVAASYDVVTHTWKLYINGTLDKTLDLGSAFTPQSGSNINACIGSSLNTGGSERAGYFNGRIDEVRIWNVARTNAEVQAGYNTELTSGTGLVGRWGLNDGSGATAANSVAGGSSGSLNRNPLWVTGFNQADPTTNASLHFNGVHDYVTFGAAAGLNTGSFTLEAWIKKEGIGSTANSGTGGVDGIPLIAKGRGEGDSPANLNMNYFFGINAGNFLVADFEESSGPNHPATATTAITDNVWTHVAVTYNVSSSVWQFYINGVAAGTLDIGTNISPVTTSIQHASLASALNSTGIPSGFFNGKMDEVRIWNRALTQTEVQTNMNNEVTSGSGLLARWGFNENCNTTLGNSVAGGINGSIISTNISVHPTDGGPSWVSNGFTNKSPNQPVNPAPANNSGAPTTSPTLCADVSDPNGGTIRVRYYGRPKPAGGGQKFTIIGMPDTQYYTAEPQGTNGGNISMFNSQTAWIAANRAAMNIVYIAQLGDCSQNGDDPPNANKQIEWQRANSAIAPIEDPVLTGLPQGIPYGITVGNHDQTPNGDPNGTTQFYNQYFGTGRFGGRAYYGGHYGTNNDNFYDFFSASGIDFLVISMEFDPAANSAVIDWAENLVQTYSTRKVIVMTHYGIDESTAFGTQGLAIYNRLKVYPNFILYLCGHIHQADGEAMRTDVYNGNTVHTILSDYQGRAGGGNGLLRIYELDPVLNKLSSKTYSPFTGTFETDADSQFDLNINLSNNSGFTLIGELNNFASGSRACINWPGLNQSTDYEWYVELFDGENTTTGPVWTFTTPASGPLPVSLVSFNANAENNKKVKVEWTTAFEKDNSRFEIQRSKDGANFSSIGTMPGRNNAASVEHYYFYDQQPFSGTSFYRLKQLDTDGKINYSRIVRVTITSKDGGIEIFPNPATGNSFQVNLLQDVKGAVEVSVYNMEGALQLRRQFNSNENIIVGHRLAAGMYMIQVRGDGLMENKKLIIR